MKKIIDIIVFKYIEFKTMVTRKRRRGTTWDKFQFALFVDGINDFREYFIREDNMNQTIYTIIKIYAYLLLTVCVSGIVGATYKLLTL